MAKKTVNLPYDLLCSIDESQAELPVNGIRIVRTIPK